jgi:hypothetical protein
MTREESSLEMWLQNIWTMDKVQIIDRSYPASSSKTFRDELAYLFTPLNLAAMSLYLNVSGSSMERH